MKRQVLMLLERFAYTSLTIMLLAGLLAPVSVQAHDPVPPPSWAGETNRVRHLFYFPDANLTPSPDETDNPFGIASAVVTLGPFAAGWRDFDPTLNPPQSSGHPDHLHGAWDLGKGPDGEIRVTFPIGNVASDPDLSGYQLEIQVNIVDFDLETMHRAPMLSVEGYAPAFHRVDSLAFPHPVFGAWSNRVWTATLDDVGEDELTLVVTADPDDGSSIDAIEIYAVARAFTPMGVPVTFYEKLGIYPDEGLGHGWADVDFYDSDGDGMLNWEEYVAGTHPLDPESKLVITLLENVHGTNYTEVVTYFEPEEGWPGGWVTQRVYEVTGLLVGWPSVDERLYDVVFKTNLSDGFWLPMDDAIDLPATPPMNTFTDAPPSEIKFYRVNVRWP